MESDMDVSDVNMLFASQTLPEFEQHIESATFDDLGDLVEYISQDDHGSFAEQLEKDPAMLGDLLPFDDMDPLLNDLSSYSPGPDRIEYVTSPIEITTSLPMNIMQQDLSPRHTLSQTVNNYNSQTQTIKYEFSPETINTAPINSPPQIWFKPSPNHMSSSPPQYHSRQSYVAQSQPSAEHAPGTQFTPDMKSVALNAPQRLIGKVGAVQAQTGSSMMYSLLNAEHTLDTVSPTVTFDEPKKQYSLLEKTLSRIGQPVESGTTIIKSSPRSYAQRTDSLTSSPPVIPAGAVFSIVPNSLANQTRMPHSIIKVTRPIQQANAQTKSGQPIIQRVGQVKPVMATQQLHQLLIRTASTPPHSSSVPTMVSNAVTFNPSSNKIPIERLVTSAPLSKKPDGKLNEHRVIEKRYRVKIKNALDNLGELVSDQKLHKAQIISKAVDYIKYLLKKNKKLQTENMLLKKEVNVRGGGVLSLMSTQPVTVPEVMDILDTGSDGGSPYNSPLNTDSETSPSYSPSFDEITLDSELSSSMDFSHLMDKSRFLLMIMFCVLSFNPFKSLFTTGGGGMNERQIGGRSLQGYGEDAATSTIVGVVSWTVTSFIALMVLLKLLVLGEPYTDRKSKAAAVYERHRKQAETDVVKGDLPSATHQLSLCLAALGRPLPTSKVDLMTSLSWQLFHHAMHRLWVKGALTRLVGRLFRMTYINRMESASEAALCYHALHEMYLTGDYPVNGLQGANLCLGAVNMAESAGTFISVTQLTRIYSTAAVHVRSVFSRRLHFCCRYFLMSARRVVSQYPSTTTPTLHWVTHPTGHNFFIHGKWTLEKNDSLFTGTKGYVSPIGRVSRCFYGNLASKALVQLMTTDPNVMQKTVQSEVLQCARLMGDAGCYGNALNEPIDAINSDSKDEVCRWWCSVIRVALSWQHHGSLHPHDDYALTDHFPKPLVSHQGNLAKAVYVAYKARRMVLSGCSEARDQVRCGQLCQQAGTLLRTSLNLMCTENVNHDPANMVIQLLILEWLLQTRLALWRLGQTSPSLPSSVSLSVSSSRSEVIGFQQDLAGLRKLSKFYQPALNRVSIHEAVNRIMSGASPLKTQRLINQSLHTAVPINGSLSDNHEATCTDSGHAHALMLSCEYLPPAMLSTPGEKTRMLADATQLYKRIGDLQAVDHCTHVLSQHLASHPLTA